MLSLIFGCSLAACSSIDIQPTIPVNIDAFQGNTYSLVQINGDAIDNTVIKDIPNLTVNEDLSLSGSLGCNRFFGGLELNGNAFKIENMGITRRLCESKLNKLENKLSSIFSTWSKAIINNDYLLLENEHGNLIFKQVK